MENFAAILVAFNFPPINLVASQRALRMARVLLGRYSKVYILRLNPVGLEESFLDYEYGKDILDHPNLECLDVDLMFNQRGLNKKKFLFHRLIGGLITRIFCGPGLDWIPSLRLALNKIPESVPIKVVIATGPPFITFKPILSWALNRSAPVILDYRDLWSKNPIARYTKISRFFVNRFIERQVNRSAALLTTVSNGCRDRILGDNVNLKVRILMNVPDSDYRNYFSVISEEYFSKALTEKNEVIRIVFSGQVYSHCTFAPILAAIVRLPMELRKLINIHYYGSCSKMVIKEFNAYKLSECLFDHGMVSKENSIKGILSADILLSLVHTESVSEDSSVTGLMTTKIFDYFLSGKPVLSIGPPDTDINRFAINIGYHRIGFHSFIAKDTTAITDFLLSVLISKPNQSVTQPLIEMPDFSSHFHQILLEAESIHAISNLN